MLDRMSTSQSLTVRRSTPDDARALWRVAALDDTLPPPGPLLVADLDGEIVAAVPLDGGRPIADPFRPTADLVSLLELRVAQLAGERSPERPRFGLLGTAPQRS